MSDYSGLQLHANEYQLAICMLVVVRDAFLKASYHLTLTLVARL